jgi:hypothetical protein
MRGSDDLLTRLTTHLCQEANGEPMLEALDGVEATKRACDEGPETFFHMSLIPSDAMERHTQAMQFSPCKSQHQRCGLPRG